MNPTSQEYAEAFRQVLEAMAWHQNAVIANLAADRTARDLDALRRPAQSQFPILDRLGQWLYRRSTGGLRFDEWAKEGPTEDTVVIIEGTYRVIEDPPDPFDRPGPTVVQVEDVP